MAPASAASALGGIGTHMSSQTSACRTRPGTSVAAKSRSGPNGTFVPVDRDLAGLVVAGGELAALVELPVGGQVGLRRDAEDPAAVDDDRGVVDAVAVPQRGADDEDGQQVPAALDHGAQGDLDGVQQRVLQQQVLDRVAGQGQLGEHRHGDAVLVAGPALAEDVLRVRRRVGQRGALRARGHARETVPVDRGEPHGEQCPACRPPPSRGPPPTGWGRRSASSASSSPARAEDQSSPS